MLIFYLEGKLIWFEKKRCSIDSRPTVWYSIWNNVC